MDKEKLIVPVLLIAGVALFYFGLQTSNEKYQDTKIASWYLNDFTNQSLDSLTNYSSTIRNYDIMFIQGITEPASFNSLCNLLRDYRCVLSPVEGRKPVQIGIIYKNTLYLQDNRLLSISIDKPPFLNKFNLGKLNLTLLSLDTDSVNVKGDLIMVQNSNITNSIILGKLKTDCAYYVYGNEFKNWKWLIMQPTTNTYSLCVYDQIIVSPELIDSVTTSEVDKTNTDNYIVWFNIHYKV
jgi:hypothetical protein